MKEKIIELVGDSLNKLNVWIDDVYLDEEGSNKFLHIVLDAEEIIPINTVVMATRIINPILDDANIIDEALELYDGMVEYEDYDNPDDKYSAGRHKSFAREKVDLEVDYLM